MNKTFKKILTLVLVCLMVLSLSGCDVVSEARKTHALIMESDGVDGLLLGETKYYQLPYDERLSPVVTNSEVINVTAPDVPVLLSYFIGESYGISDDGVFIFSWEDYLYYCREDKYSELCDIINGELTLSDYCYTYYSFDETEYTGVEHRVLLSQTEKDAINSVLTNVEPTMTDDYDYSYSVDIFACSNDTLFMEGCAAIIVDGTDGGDEEYSLLVYGDEYDLLYAIPEKELEILSAMIDTVAESEEYYYDYYVDEF